MAHEIGHILGIYASGNLYTRLTAAADSFVFNGAHAKLKYKELKGNGPFEDDLITDGGGHWLGHFLYGDIMCPRWWWSTFSNHPVCFGRYGIQN